MLRIGVTIGFNRFAEFAGNAQRWAEGITSEAAGAIQNEARRRAPIDTGRLWRSIQVNPAGPNSYQVEATAPYSSFVELGTVYQSAQPYFYPAVEAARSGFLSNLKGSMEDGLAGKQVMRRFQGAGRAGEIERDTSARRDHYRRTGRVLPRGSFLRRAG